MSLIDANTDLNYYDCKEAGHFDAVSGCCGSGEYPEVEGMCGGCREFTGWVCSVCDEDMSKEVYGD